MIWYGTKPVRFTLVNLRGFRMEQDSCEICFNPIYAPFKTQLCNKCNDVTQRCEDHELLSKKGEPICEVCHNLETDEEGDFIR